MKIKKSILHITGIIILLLSVQFVNACPKCNQDFYQELLGKRANTLGGQELLEAIKNQSIPGEPSALVLPATYNKETDITQPDIQNTPDPEEIKDVDNNNSMLSTCSTFVIMVEQFISLNT